jgi:multiple antibiotic resistance protein
MLTAAVLAFLKTCLLVLSALFPIVNPLGNSPIFLSLTAGYSSSFRSILSRKIALNSFWLLTGSMLIGSWSLLLSARHWSRLLFSSAIASPNVWRDCWAKPQ